MRQKQDTPPEGQGMDKSLDHRNQAISNSDDRSSRERLESENFNNYPSGLKLVFVFVALCLTVFLVALVRITNVPASPWVTW